MKTFLPEQLHALAMALIQSMGSETSEARIVANHLIEANLRGHDSHGIGMIPTYFESLHKKALFPNTPVRKVADRGPILQFDGQRGYGQRVAQEAMLEAIDRCRENGLTMMTLRNAHHIGRVGTYGELAQAAGLASLHFTNVVDHPATVAPHGGAEPKFGTNPVCIALPGTDANPPFLLDFATSQVALGKTRVAYEAGKTFEEPVLLNCDGHPTGDPAVMWEEPKGALRPFGLHKGYGMIMAAEVLGGIFSGGKTLQPEHEQLGGVVNNMMVILFDPAMLDENGQRDHEIDALYDYVRSCRPADSEKPVRIAGDPERQARRQRLKEGIPLAEGAVSRLLDVAEQSGLGADKAEALIEPPAA